MVKTKAKSSRYLSRQELLGTLACPTNLNDLKDMLPLPQYPKIKLNKTMER